MKVYKEVAMKKIIIIMAVLFMTSVSMAFAEPKETGEDDTQAYTAIVPGAAAVAEWVADFEDSFKKNGVYQAVAEVFGEGYTPLEILTHGMDMEGMNPQNLIAAIYCAGAEPEHIRQATEELGLSELILLAGFKTAKTVCEDVVTDTQAYTPVVTGFSGPPAGGDNAGTYGSPSSPSN